MRGDRDEVDRLIACWNRERPDLDTAPMAVLSRVTRLAWQVERARRAAFAEHGLEAFEFDVLVALRRCGAPHELSPGRLAGDTLVTSGTMTNRLDRLERRDLVRRLPDPRDGRAVRVRLTPAGRSRADAALGDLLDRERALLAGLTDQQRTTLADLLRRVGTAFDESGGDD
ncbi:MAG TPA: MarR family transcriptional regulator [Mycobacteriales bacterium]|nr:MarR family transcriptional regulator [Mycobacteriales bacterium]